MKETIFFSEKFLRVYRNIKRDTQQDNNINLRIRFESVPVAYVEYIKNTNYKQSLFMYNQSTILLALQQYIYI